MRGEVKRDALDEFYRFIGLAVAVLVVFGLVNGLAFGLLGYLIEPASGRIITLALVWTALGAFVIGYRLGHRSGEEHVLGVHTGIEMKVAAQTRPPSAPRPLTPAISTPAFTSHNAVLDEPIQIITPSKSDLDW